MTTHSAIPLFPAELVDLIVDASRTDRKALATYALVSKEWTPRSRHHLFEKATILADNARQFVSLLFSPQCTFATAIRELNISLAASGSQRWLIEFSRRIRPVLFKTDNLHHLAISGSRNTVIRRLEGDSGARAALVAFGRQNQEPGQIMTLKIGPITFESFADFVEILSAFPDLHTLASAAHFQDATRPELHQEICILPQVTKIDLSSPSTNNFFEFLLDQGILHTVTSLALSQLAGADLPILGRFLQAPNNIALQNLVIKIDHTLSGVSFEVFAQQVDMTQLRALRHLVVKTAPDMPPGPAHAMLSTISSTDFERLEISLLLTQEASRIGDLLTGARFHALKEVIIPGASFAEAAQYLPLCAAKNILREV